MCGVLQIHPWQLSGDRALSKRGVMWWTRALSVAGKWPALPSLNNFNDPLLQEQTHDPPQNIDIGLGCFALVINGEQPVSLVQGPNTVVGATNAIVYSVGCQVPVSSYASVA